MSLVTVPALTHSGLVDCVCRTGRDAALHQSRHYVKDYPLIKYLVGGAFVALSLAACGSTTVAPSQSSTALPQTAAPVAHVVTPVPTVAPTAVPTSMPAVAANCPQTYTGQKVDLTGTITATFAVGGNFFSVIKDGNGQTCQLVTATNPGQVGALIAVHGLVGYVSPGSPPINRIAFAAYAAGDH